MTDVRSVVSCLRETSGYCLGPCPAWGGDGENLGMKRQVRAYSNTYASQGLYVLLIETFYHIDCEYIELITRYYRINQ
jgi:hypothetical protein